MFLSIDQSIKQSINQVSNRSIKQSINQSIYKSKLYLHSTLHPQGNQGAAEQNKETEI